MDNKQDNSPSTNSVDAKTSSAKIPDEINKVLDEAASDEHVGTLIDDSEEDKRPVLAVLGLVLTVVLWIAVFAFPNTSMAQIKLWMVIFAAGGIGSFVMCLLGRRRAPMLALIGMIAAASLVVFLVIGIIAAFLVD